MVQQHLQALLCPTVTDSLYSRHRLKPGCNQHSPCSWQPSLGHVWEKSALGSWGATMSLQRQGETAGGKRSSPATTQGQRHYLKLSPFTSTQVPQAVKHKKALGFSKTATSSRFHAWKVTTFKSRLCGKSPADKTPRDCKRSLNIAKGRAASQSGLVCRVRWVIWACAEYSSRQNNLLRAKPIGWLEYSSRSFGQCLLGKGSKGQNELKGSSPVPPKQRVDRRHSKCGWCISLQGSAKRLLAASGKPSQMSTDRWNPGSHPQHRNNIINSLRNRDSSHGRFHLRTLMNKACWNNWQLLHITCSISKIFTVRLVRN